MGSYRAVGMGGIGDSRKKEARKLMPDGVDTDTKNAWKQANSPSRWKDMAENGNGSEKGNGNGNEGIGMRNRHGGYDMAHGT